jgi:hypothetical protein
MALKSNNSPYRGPESGGGMGGGFSGEKGYYFEKEYAAIFDGIIGGFILGETGELISPYGIYMGGPVLHPSYGLQIDSYWLDDGTWLYSYNPDTGGRVNGFSLGWLVDGLMSFLPATSNARHLGASDARFKTGWFVNIYSSGGFTTADLIFKNDWVITEEEDKLIFINPDGKKVLELTPKGKLNETKDDKKYNNAEKFKLEEQLKVKKPTKKQNDERIKTTKEKIRQEFAERFGKGENRTNPKKYSANKNSSNSNS